ncbi:MAG: PHP domain-containing protein, partial [Lentisphaeria bacterium]
MSLDFVHLHVHSDYSMLDGACQVKKLVKKVKQLGQKALAITDHGNMFNVFDFYSACKDEGIKPIIGCEFYITANELTDRSDKTRYHLVLLAKDYEGYQNMCHLNEVAWSDEGFFYKPRIDRASLKKYSKGLICTSACIGGEVPQKFLKGDEQASREALEFYLSVFGKEDFYLEMQNHGKAGIDANNAPTAEWRDLLTLEQKANVKLQEFAKEYDLKLICSNDAHYLNEGDNEAHDALLCIGTQSNLSDEKRFRFSGDQFYVKSTEEMAILFGDCPEALTNTVEIAEKCNVEIPMYVNHYPVYFLQYASEMASSGFAPPLPEIMDNHEDSHCPIRRRYLYDICVKGLEKRYNLFEPDNENYVVVNESEPSLEYRKEILDRMNFEL